MDFGVLRSGYAWVCPCSSKMIVNDNNVQWIVWNIKYEHFTVIVLL